MSDEDDVSLEQSYDALDSFVTGAWHVSLPAACDAAWDAEIRGFLARWEALDAEEESSAAHAATAAQPAVSRVVGPTHAAQPAEAAQAATTTAQLEVECLVEFVKDPSVPSGEESAFTPLLAAGGRTRAAAFSSTSEQLEDLLGQNLPCATTTTRTTVLRDEYIGEVHIPTGMTMKEEIEKAPRKRLEELGFEHGQELGGVNRTNTAFKELSLIEWWRRFRWKFHEDGFISHGW